MVVGLSEITIETYMKDFNVSREIAISEMNECLEDYHEIQEAAMQEVYEGIIRGSR